MSELPNPGVPTIIVYGNSYVVDKSFTYYEDPLDKLSEKNSFYFPEKTAMSRGDGTVLTVSAVTPGLKWDYVYLLIIYKLLSFL